ncbi:long-chain-fatty-acid--CoA ligase FadD13 [bacterium BMS3Abin03]|nr:long-chain-fatty-acid--CoA ligase FadD13 [bacterium BMS3Abin03]
MYIDFLLEVFEKNKSSTSIIWNEKSFSYNWLIDKVSEQKEFLKKNRIQTGQVVSVKGDFSPVSISLLLALIENRNIIVPLINSSINDADKKLKIAGAELIISIDENDNTELSQLPYNLNHEFYNNLRENNYPGLVLFTSGTSGEPKAAVHNFTKLLEKFKTPRKSLRTVNFLLFDHWGGLNTLFHTISNGGVVLALHDRSPEKVCAFIEKHKIELLPASPTFLNLLLISEAYKNYDLSSMKLITYGTEPMPESTLKRIKEIFPGIKLQQTYGLIELGVLRSKSKSDDSLWVKIGGEGFNTRIVDGMLQIKADSAMLGYLNAPSPFTDDGYFITGDAVEVNGEYIKILGRKSELINVGGEKVYPAEVEDVILQLNNVADATVFSEKNPITGNIVCAKVSLKQDEDKKDFTKRLKRFCRSKLESFKVPVKITITNELQHSERFKKKRAGI